MFRTMRMRLLVTYVLGAVLLVLIVTAAITAFALSRFASGTEYVVAEVERNAPEVARSELKAKKSLEEAAPQIVRQLERSGAHVLVLRQRNGAMVPLAFGARPPRTEFPFRLSVLFGIHPRNVLVPGGQIAIFPDMRPLEKALSELTLAMLPVSLLVGILAFMFGRYITDQALRPLVETTESLQRFAAGDFTPRPIAVSGRNEIGELVSAYNGAAAQVALAFEERAKAEQEMRRFIADAGHELRTPLTVIMGFLDVLRRRKGGDPALALRAYDTMQVESRRMKVLIEKLIVLARLGNPLEKDAEDVNLAALASHVVSSLGALHESSRISLRAEPDVVVYAHESEVYDAVANILDNALKYAPDSPVEVSVSAEGGRALLSITDRGPGVSEEDRERIFERFYRAQSRGQSEGFGLGLAIAKRSIERAGGQIRLVSALGKGCCFTIALPLSAYLSP